MKKILLISSSIQMGGAERIAINTYNCLKEHYDVTLLVQQRREIEYSFSGKMIDVQLPEKRTKLGRVFNRLKRIFKVVRARNKIKPDFVISFGASSNLLNVISGIFSKGKTITAIHGFRELQKSRVFKFILSHSDKVICISQAMQNGLLKLYPKTKKSVVIENGYEIEKITTLSTEKNDFEETNPYVVIVGRLNPVKRFDIAIRAFSRIEKIYPDMHLLVLGDGDKRSELIELSGKLSLAEKVKFLGCKENPFVYLKNAKLFIMSSQNEGFPNVLIEALACGVPIVSVDCESGPREILSENFSKEPIRGIIFEKYGVLVEQSSNAQLVSEMLGEAMKNVLTDDEKMSQYKNNGIERAKEFDQSVYKVKVMNLLNSLN